MSRDRQKKLFVELINKQLEPFGKTYEEVVHEPNWFMNYKTTKEAETEFINYCIDKIMKDLGLNRKRAEMEASWFILQWGLTTSNNEFNQNKTEKVEKIKVRRKN
jgi:hypoxanthine phosphoribosyltransferase